MPLDLSRKELYDLVWAKPRTEIARQFGISDVRLGVLCRELNVPTPPRGYWANLAGNRRKRKYVKPALTYSVAERIEEDHASIRASFPDFDPRKLDQPIPPAPVVPYSLDEALGRYRRLVDAVPVPNATRGLHPITQKFIAEDERLAALAKQYSWYEPRFESPEGKLLLEGLNRLLWLWVDLGFKPRSSGIRDIKMSIGIGGYRRSLEVTRRTPTPTHGRHPAKDGSASIEFWFDTQAWERQSSKPTLVFPAFNRSVFRTIALLAIEHWERSFRESLQRHYEWSVSDRRHALEQVELARERERQRAAAALQALLESRQTMLQAAISGAVRSREIQSLVQVLDERIGSRIGEVPAFASWRAWALSEAETVDPTNRSLVQLNEWFAKFQLDRSDTR